jgi:hypothetical protein
MPFQALFRKVMIFGVSFVKIFKFTPSEIEFTMEAYLQGVYSCCRYKRVVLWRPLFILKVKHA